MTGQREGMSETSNIPRWATGAAREIEAKPDWLWTQINDLLMDGMDATDVMRELGLPESKLRSLQLHAQKFGARRRLVLFDRFKEAMLRGATGMGEDFARAMSLIARYATSENTPEDKQVAACAMMNTFARTLIRAMRTDEIAETRRTENESQTVQVDPAEAMKRILDLYGIKPVETQ